LGFLDLSDLLGEDYQDSGSIGMHDIVSALRWVRDNIGQFGGDPENVTIFGVSGGGYKVGTLLAMPDASGLFHRAIVQSGGGSRLELPERARARALALLGELDLKDARAHDLFDLPVQALIDAQTALVRRSGGMVDGGLGFSPHVDGRVVTDHPGRAVAAGAASRVPLLIGSNRHEFTRFFADFSPLDDDSLLSVLQATTGAAAAAVIEAYRLAEPGASGRDLLTLILSDQMTRVPSIKFAEEKVFGGDAPVYMYLLNWESPAYDGVFRSAHTVETPLVFGNVEEHPLTAHQPGSQTVSDIMSDAWVHFATTGDPNSPGLPHWDPYIPTSRSTMVLNVSSSQVSDPHSEERLAWEGVPTGEEILV
jgi:para-nitrobenzyl esterase